MTQAECICSTHGNLLPDTSIYTMRPTAAQLGTLHVTDGRIHSGEVCLQELQRAHINLQCVTWFLTTYVFLTW